MPIHGHGRFTYELPVYRVLPSGKQYIIKTLPELKALTDVLFKEYKDFADNPNPKSEEDKQYETELYDDYIAAKNALGHYEYHWTRETGKNEPDPEKVVEFPLMIEAPSGMRYEVKDYKDFDKFKNPEIWQEEIKKRMRSKAFPVGEKQAIADLEKDFKFLEQQKAAIISKGYRYREGYQPPKREKYTPSWLRVKPKEAKELEKSQVELPSQATAAQNIPPQATAAPSVPKTPMESIKEKEASGGSAFQERRRLQEEEEEKAKNKKKEIEVDQKLKAVEAEKSDIKKRIEATRQMKVDDFLDNEGKQAIKNYNKSSIDEAILGKQELLKKLQSLAGENPSPSLLQNISFTANEIQFLINKKLQANERMIQTLENQKKGIESKGIQGETRSDPEETGYLPIGEMYDWERRLKEESPKDYEHLNRVYGHLKRKGLGNKETTLSNIYNKINDRKKEGFKHFSPDEEHFLKTYEEIKRRQSEKEFQRAEPPQATAAPMETQQPSSIPGGKTRPEETTTQKTYVTPHEEHKGAVYNTQTEQQVDPEKVKRLGIQEAGKRLADQPFRQNPFATEEPMVRMEEEGLSTFDRLAKEANNPEAVDKSREINEKLLKQYLDPELRNARVETLKDRLISQVRQNAMRRLEKSYQKLGRVFSAAGVGRTGYEERMRQEMAKEMEMELAERETQETMKLHQQEEQNAKTRYETALQAYLVNKKEEESRIERQRRAAAEQVAAGRLVRDRLQRRVDKQSEEFLRAQEYPWRNQERYADLINRTTLGHATPEDIQRVQSTQPQHVAAAPPAQLEREIAPIHNVQPALGHPPEKDTSFADTTAAALGAGKLIMDAYNTFGGGAKKDEPKKL